MRFGRRSAIVASVVAASAVAVAGVAIAATRSTAVFSFSPDKVPKRTYKAGKLFVHTHTNYRLRTRARRSGHSSTSTTISRLSTRGIPECNKSKISGTVTMQAAMAACGRAKVGSGKAAGRRGANHGQRVRAGLQRQAAERQADASAVHEGERRAPVHDRLLETRRPTRTATRTCSWSGSTSGPRATIGTQLDIDHIDTASALPLTDFRVTVKRRRYVSATMPRQQQDVEPEDQVHLPEPERDPDRSFIAVLQGGATSTTATSGPVAPRASRRGGTPCPSGWSNAQRPHRLGVLG